MGRRVRRKMNKSFEMNAQAAGTNSLNRIFFIKKAGVKDSGK